MDDKEQSRRMTNQTKEFDAAFEFADKVKGIGYTSVVDDDYPRVRFEYERALVNLLTALKENDRFGVDSRYGLVPVKSNG